MKVNLANQKDEDLLQWIKSDNRALKVIYDRHWLYLFRYAKNILEDKEIAADIVQEVFISLWEKPDASAIKNLSAYLLQATRNQIFKQIRRNKITQRYLDQIDQSVIINNAEESIIVADLEKELTQLIHVLPDRCRQIFILSRVEFKTHREISLQLGISVQTVKNQISKALSFLNEGMSNDIAFAWLVLLAFLECI